MNDVFITGCYCFLVSLCEDEVYVFEIPDLTIFESRSVIFDNHFWVSISYTWVLSSRFERTEVCDLFLMMSLCDMFWLDHFGVFDQYCDLYWDTFWLLSGEPLDIVIYHWCLQMLIEICCDHYNYYLMLISCSWRTDVIIVDYIYDVFQSLV